MTSGAEAVDETDRDGFVVEDHVSIFDVDDDGDHLLVLETGSISRCGRRSVRGNLAISQRIAKAVTNLGFASHDRRCMQ